MKIILTGMRGSGKTTIAKLLGKKLRLDVFDTDTLIAKKSGMPLADYITKNGWAKFRAMECKIVKKMATSDNVIISTGGGTLMNKKNATLLKKNSIVILLTAPIKTLKKRIGNAKERPSLTGIDAQKELQTVWQKRKKTYTTVADLIIENTGTVQKTLKKIYARVQTN